MIQLIIRKPTSLFTKISILKNMKLGLTIILVYCFVIQNTASGQTLPQLLENAQTQTDQLHSFLSSVLLNIRMEMTKTLTVINRDSLSHILIALEKAQSLIDFNEEMKNDSENIGKNVSLCSAQADNDIQETIKEFFKVFNPAHENSSRMLNTVLEQIYEWNRISDPNDIAVKVRNILNGISNEFIEKTVPALEEELKKLKGASILIPLTVSKCVGKLFH